MSRVRVSMPSLVHGISQLSAAERQPVHALACDNVWPLVDKGSQKRPPLIHVAKIQNTTFGDCYCHGIDRGSGERYISLFRFGATTANGIVFDTLGTVIPVFRNTGTYAVPVYDVCQYLYLASGSNPSQTIRAMTVLDYTFITNRNIAVTMSSSTTTAAPTNIAYDFIRQGAFSMKYTVKIQNGTGTVWTIHAQTHESIAVGSQWGITSVAEGFDVWDLEGSGSGNPTPPSNFAKTSVKTQDIADLLMQKLNGVGSTGTYGTNQVTAGIFTVTRNGSVLKIVANNTGAGGNNGTITLFEVSTSQGNQLAFGIFNETDSFTNLPLIFTHDAVVKIKGNTLADEDDFWVKFVGDNSALTTLQEGTWSETLKPGITYTWVYTPSSLHPHVLVRRTSDGINPASVAAGDKFFSFEPANLAARAVGDTTSAANPHFVSIAGTYQPAGGGGTSYSFPVTRKVKDFAFFRDRLVLICDESLSCSEQGVYLNFFRTTVRALPDSDPIDVSISGNRTTIYHSAVPFAGVLVLFADQIQSQFLGTPNLTPNTAEGTQVSQFQSTPACAPQAYKDGVLYASIGGSHTTLRSLYPKVNVEDQFDSENLSIHTPSYMPGTPKQIEVNTDSSVAAMLVDGDTDAIYILKQHREGDKILQSAWVRFVIAGATIRGVKFFDSKLYVVTEHTALSTAVTYTAVAAGNKSGMGLKSDGTIAVWGYSPAWAPITPPSFGVLTVTKIATNAPLISTVSSGLYMALMSNGTIIAWGDNDSGEQTIPALPGGVTYTHMSAGKDHALARRSDGAVVAWGSNAFGQGTVPSLPGGVTYTNVAGGHYHSAALRSDGNIVCFGLNGDGQCTVPVLGGGLTYTGVACGFKHTVGLVSDGSVRCWGQNTFGQTTVPSFGGLTATKVAAGESHTLALMNNGTILTWGLSTNNLGSVPALPAGKTYTDLDGGSDHSLAVRSDGVIIGWGAKDQLQTEAPPPFGSGATVGLYLGYIDLSPAVTDSTRDYWLTLDRRVTNLTSGVSIAVASGITTITLPYDLESGAFMEVVNVNSLTRYFGTITGINTFSVPVDLTGVSFVAGKRYTSTHSFHKPEVAISEQNGRRLILDSTSAVVQLLLRYENTTYFKVICGSESKDVGTPFDVPSNPASEPESGTVTVGVFSRLDSQFDCRVENNSPFPHTLVSGEWLLNATIRSQALR